MTPEEQGGLLAEAVREAVKVAVAAERERCAAVLEAEAQAAFVGAFAWYHPHHHLRAVAARLREGS